MTNTESVVLTRYIVAPNGCWVWQGTIDKSGYPRISIKHRLHSAHRIAYKLLVGPIPEGLTLDHTCHDPKICVVAADCLHRSCINPSHLVPATFADNAQRGNCVSALNRQKTHCVNGHPFNEENTYRCPRGWRQCRTCRDNKEEKPN